MEMDLPVGKLSQLLKQIWWHSQSINQTFLCSDLQDKDGEGAWVSTMILLCQELNGALCQHLEHVSGTLQVTCQQLHILLDKQKPCIWREEINALIDCLKKISDYLKSTVIHLQKKEKDIVNLQAMNHQYISLHTQSTIQNIFSGTNISEKGKMDYIETAHDSSQPFPQISPPSEGESHSMSQIQTQENKELMTSAYAEEENITLMNGNVMRQEMEFNEMSLENMAEKLCKQIEAADGEKNNVKREEINATRSSKEFPREFQSIMENMNEENRMSSMNDIENRYGGNVLTNDLENLSQTNQVLEKAYLVSPVNETGSKVACYITAPSSVLQNLTCQIINDMSSLVVNDSEELVSNVISVEYSDHEKRIPFPISIAIPFSARYRGNYRDIMVKVSDGDLQSSYINLSSLEGTRGSHKGTWAEVKVYKLGIFSVVSCLKKESFMVPKKGLSLKLSMDPRISLSYPSGVFTSSVLVQLKVQPIDPSLLSTLKTKQDIYYSVVSTSPLIHLQQPSTHPFHKPVTIILPCSPNTERKTPGAEIEHKRAISATFRKITTSYHIRAKSASIRKPGDNVSESLKLLGFRTREGGWFVLDDAVVRNVQSGIVSFELHEHLDRCRNAEMSIIIQEVALQKNHLGCTENANQDLDQHSETLILPPDLEETIAEHTQTPMYNHEKLINHPQSTKRTSTDPSEALWENLLYWLAEELSEENAASLAESLPLRRSTIQLVKLKNPDNLTEQIYEFLSFWKKTLPTSVDKQRLLSRHLRKIGRSDLSEELKYRWENKVFSELQLWSDVEQ
ncbi:death domain-containing protein 1 [Gracilinanus agilis]|uniref:death domain-containing protein 1 n=1 Tax=Gracilinanus agilis TaxID=191870 RepID=UPI001CFCC73E|nr:death domain-containing protein 1 [Gracilinanus agilis]